MASRGVREHGRSLNPDLANGDPRSLDLHDPAAATCSTVKVGGMGTPETAPASSAQDNRLQWLENAGDLNEPPRSRLAHALKLNGTCSLNSTDIGSVASSPRRLRVR